MELEELSARILAWIKREAPEALYSQWKPYLTNERTRKWLISPFDEIWNFYVLRTVSKKNLDPLIYTLKLNNMYDELITQTEEETFKKILVKKRQALTDQSAHLDALCDEFQGGVDAHLSDIKMMEKEMSQFKKRAKQHNRESTLLDFINGCFLRETQKCRDALTYLETQFNLPATNNNVVDAKILEAIAKELSPECLNESVNNVLILEKSRSIIHSIGFKH